MRQWAVLVAAATLMSLGLAAASAADPRATAAHVTRSSTVLAPRTSVHAQTVATRLPPPAGNASIAGTVVDGLTGKGLPRVRVFSLGAFLISAMTDDQGAFEISGLAEGTYPSLRVDVPGRGSGQYGALRPGGGGLSITVTAGQRRDLRILVWPRGTVSGRVTNPDGSPVTGATVEIARRVFTLASYVADYSQDTIAMTGGNGTYHADLPPGHYLVTVRSTNVTIPASVQEAYHQELATPSIGSFVTDRLQLSAAPIITGQGLVVGESRYQVMALRQPRTPAAPSSAAGITNTYSSSAREIDIQPGTQTSLDLPLAMVPAFTLSGIVRGPKGGAFVAVRLTSLSEPAMMQFSTGPPVSSETAIAITDAGGAFTMLGVPAGRYEVFVRVGADGPTVPPPQRSGTSESVRTELTVVDADVKGLTLALRPTPVVAGQITFVGDPPPTSAQKAVMRFGLYEDLLSSTPKPILPLIHPDGSFQFSGEVPGRYWPTGDFGDWALEHISINGQSFDDRVIALGDEGLSNISVVARRWKERKDVLWGTVNLPPGLASEEVTVAAFPTDYAQRVANGNFTSRRVRSARLRPEGFNLGILPPGDYFLVAYREADGQDPTQVFFDRLASHADRARVNDGEPTFVKLMVPDVGR